MPRRCNWFATVVMWVATCVTPNAIATPITSSYLPISEQQFQTSTGSFGGNAACTTTGSYDATSLRWTQLGVCSTTGLSGDAGERLFPMSTRASLAGLVDNSGDVLGGVFSLFATIPELGWTDWTLLAAGRLVDADYGPFMDGFYTTGSNSLISLDYVAEPIRSLGSALLWAPYGQIGPWQFANDPWTTSVSYSGNFSGTTYFFFDKKTLLVPEPSAFVLVTAGLFTLGLVARRRRVR